MLWRERHLERTSGACTNDIWSMYFRSPLEIWSLYEYSLFLTSIAPISWSPLDIGSMKKMGSLWSMDLLLYLLLTSVASVACTLQMSFSGAYMLYRKTSLERTCVHALLKDITGVYMRTCSKDIWSVHLEHVHATSGAPDVFLSRCLSLERTCMKCSRCHSLQSMYAPDVNRRYKKEI